MDSYKVWYDFTKSKLRVAELLLNDTEISFNDIMYSIQQVMEFALKTLIVYNKNCMPPKTHDMSVLCSIVEEQIKLPQDILETIISMTDFVTQRYPHEFEIGNIDDCKEAYKIARKLIDILKNEIETHNIFR